MGTVVVFIDPDVEEPDLLALEDDLCMTCGFGVVVRAYNTLGRSAEQLREILREEHALDYMLFGELSRQVEFLDAGLKPLVLEEQYANLALERPWIRRNAWNSFRRLSEYEICWRPYEGAEERLPVARILWLREGHPQWGIGWELGEMFSNHMLYHLLEYPSSCLCAVLSHVRRRVDYDAIVVNSCPAEVMELAQVAAIPILTLDDGGRFMRFEYARMKYEATGY